MASKSHSEFGTGGMETKIKAARIVARLGIDTIIASGFEIDILLKIKSKNFVGTQYFLAKKTKLLAQGNNGCLITLKLRKAILDSGAITRLFNLISLYYQLVSLKSMGGLIGEIWLFA